MKIQLLITAMALATCAGLPVKPEPRKFVYQVGFPSVRRYPVYPDRLLDMDQTQMLVKFSTEKDPLGETDFMLEMKEDEGTSTDSLVLLESEFSTTYRPSTAASTTAVFDEATTSTTPLTFTPQPQPSSFQSKFSSVSSSSSSSIGTTGTFEDISTTQAEPALASSDSLPPLINNFVFPSAPANSREPVDFDSSPSVSTVAPEDSTDVPMATDLPTNEFMEETMTNPTIAPLEEELEELPESTTGDAIFDQTVTQSPWDSVTQEIYTTEAIETF